MTRFDPGVQPNSRSPASKCSRWRKASSGGDLPGESTPTRGTLGGCASAKSGTAKRANNTMPVRVGRTKIISPPSRDRTESGSRSQFPCAGSSPDGRVIESPNDLQLSRRRPQTLALSCDGLPAVGSNGLLGGALAVAHDALLCNRPKPYTV